MKNDFEDKIIEVCDACHMACCWYGIFYCDDSRNAGTVKYTVSELRAMNGGKGTDENECYWSDEFMKDVYGEAAPHGYK